MTIYKKKTNLNDTAIIKQLFRYQFKRNRFKKSIQKSVD